MGEYEKAVDLFINNNPCGINDDAIGFILGTDCDRPDEAQSSLCMAKTIADEFDRVPNYNVDRIRFVSTSRPATSYDDMGATAIEGIRNLIKSYKNETLSELFFSKCWLSKIIFRITLIS